MFRWHPRNEKAIVVPHSDFVISFLS